MSLITLAEQLRAARLDRGWSQARLALETGTAQGHIWRIEQGRDVHLSTVLRIAAALGVSLNLTRDVEAPGVAA